TNLFNNESTMFCDAYFVSLIIPFWVVMLFSFAQIVNKQQMCFSLNACGMFPTPQQCTSVLRNAL
ncbi:hypothetical protein, partial [Litorimonas sp.]|uniref:hypothetical protein n=1 Tax=Litorimonas sp. TaxID=1892381 RepID=UPI003A8B30F0